MEAQQDYEYLRNLTILFFLEKLLDKGDSRSLHDLSCQFGTKGFSKEMRQIAGGSKAGLRRFLSQYPSLFCVEDDAVSVARIQQGGPGAGSRSSLDADEDAGSRDYGREAMLYFKEKLRQYGEAIEVPIKSLLGHRSQAPPEVRHFSGQHIKEFREFLLRYDQDFVVTEETIYLKEYEGTVIQMFSEDKPAGRSDVTAELVEYIKSILQGDDDTREIEFVLAAILGKFAGRADELPFKTEQNLRTFLKIYPSAFVVQGRLVSLADRQMPGGAPASNCSRPTSSMASQVPRQMTPPRPRDENVSLKDRVNSVLQKVVADNFQRDRRSELEGRSEVDGGIKPEPRQVLRVGHVQVITEWRECQAVLEGLLAATAAEKEKVVALEIKGTNLGPEGYISAVHIGDSEGRVYMLDMTALPEIIYKEHLKRLLESEEIIKVLHDCRNESANLWFQHGIQLRNVFDTQAAYAVLQHQDNVNPVHKVKNLSISALCKCYNISSHETLEMLKSNSKKDPKLWIRRPFDSDTINLAALEVITLATSLFPKLKRHIRDESQPLFKDLCEEQVKLHIEPELIKTRKNQRKIDLEIADIKQKLGSSNGKNVVLSNREIRLLRFIELTEDDVKKIKGSAKVAKKLERLCNLADSEEMGDFDSNPPSLESISSGSGTFNSPNSPLSLGYDSTILGMSEASQVNGFERIEKLEAIIANMSHIGNGMTRTADTCSTRNAETQTLSTGDIVMTKVYAS